MSHIGSNEQGLMPDETRPFTAEHSLPLSGQGSCHNATSGHRATGSPGIARSADTAVAELLWNARRWIVAVPLVVAFSTAAIVLALPARYQARTAFTGEWGGASIGSMGGLAGLAGLAGATGLTGLTSADLFATVVKSDTVVQLVLARPFSFPGGDSKLLANTLVPDERQADVRTALAADYLRERMSVLADRRTNVVTLTVTLEDPVLAAGVANALVEELNHFNIAQRRTQFGEQRRFAEERLATAEQELHAAEDALEAFLDQNRSLGTSPSLRAAYDRFERSVAMRQDVASTIRRRYEEARIAEVQDTPVITIIDRARVPHLRSWPRRTATVIITTTLAGGIVILLALFQPQWSPILADWRRMAIGRRQAV